MQYQQLKIKRGHIAKYVVVVFLFACAVLSHASNTNARHVQSLAGTTVPGQASETTTLVSILILGDSLSAAYGINPLQGWVSLLDKHLNQSANHYRIINASISGETTNGGLRRLPALLKKHQPDVVVIELGANDGLRGYPVTTIRNNLKRLIVLSQQANARILLAGMRLPPNYGSHYTRLFHESFALMADQHKVVLIPFLLEGVAGKTHFIQTDGLHPTAEAQPLILQNVLPYLQKVLSSTH